VTVGSNLTYTIAITNKGFWPASSVTLTDVLPASVQFVSVTPSQVCTTNDTGAVVCSDLGPLAKGAGTAVTITVVAATSGQTTNVAFCGSVRARSDSEQQFEHERYNDQRVGGLAAGQTASTNVVSQATS